MLKLMHTATYNFKNFPRVTSLTALQDERKGAEKENGRKNKERMRKTGRKEKENEDRPPTSFGLKIASGVISVNYWESQ